MVKKKTTKKKTTKRKGTKRKATKRKATKRKKRKTMYGGVLLNAVWAIPKSITERKPYVQAFKETFGYHPYK